MDTIEVNEFKKWISHMSRNKIVDLKSFLKEINLSRLKYFIIYILYYKGKKCEISEDTHRIVIKHIETCGMDLNILLYRNWSNYKICWCPGYIDFSYKGCCSIDYVYRTISFNKSKIKEVVEIQNFLDYGFNNLATIYNFILAVTTLIKLCVEYIQKNKSIFGYELKLLNKDIRKLIEC